MRDFLLRLAICAVLAAAVIGGQSALHAGAGLGMFQIASLE